MREDCIARLLTEIDRRQELTRITLMEIVGVLKHILTTQQKENRIMATTKELLDEVSGAVDNLVTAVNDGFGRLEAIIAGGGQVSQSDIDQEKAILSKLTDETAKAVAEGA